MIEVPVSSGKKHGLGLLRPFYHAKAHRTRGPDFWIDYLYNTMKSFSDWYQQRLDEDAKRTGVRPQYPDGYARFQYPPEYFPPLSAEAIFDLMASTPGLKLVSGPIWPLPRE